MQAQVIEGMPFEEYLKRPELSRSQLFTMNTSPWHFLRQFKAPKETTRPMIFGRAFNSLVIEPDLFEAQFAVDPTPPRPDVDGRTKAGKAAVAEWAGECAEMLKPLEGKEILTREEFAMLTQMADEIREQPQFAAAMRFEPRIEASIIWQDVSSEIECRVRPDIWTRDSNLLLDLKTIDEATPYRIRQSVMRYGYDLQDAMYCRGVEYATGELPPPMIFLFAEKQEPYKTVPYVIGDASREKAFALYDKLMGQVEECSLAGEWPRYPEGIQTVETWR